MEVSRLYLGEGALKKIFKFNGGVHPSTYKTISNQADIKCLPMPSRLVIPFKQHAGEAAKPLVKAGDHVLKGRLIGMPEGLISGAIHAPTSGTITAIDEQPVAHPSELADLCATLVPDGKDEWVQLAPIDYRDHTSEDIRHRLRMAGVVGLGGATFPSNVKLRKSKFKINTLILNGAECEPYITCDDLLMRKHADEIIRGAEILRHVLDATEVLIGIEDNKPEAIDSMRQAIAELGFKFDVVAVPTIYPGGGVKQLIQVLTGLEVTSGKLPNEIGVQCFNVATTRSIYRALEYGEPLLSRIVTITGNVNQPGNYEALIGTPIDELIAGVEKLTDTNGYIMGGPMMGIRLPSVGVPMVKATNCIIAASDKLFPPAPPALPCIRCTRCVDVCPVELQPQDLYWFSKAKEFGKAQTFSLFDCIECGACSYVCPSHIPLVQYFRFAKSEIQVRALEKQNSDKARERHEFREYRIEREKKAKAEKLAARERVVLAAKEKAALVAKEGAVTSATEFPAPTQSEAVIPRE
jgi:electron transport complex protein RnfC